MTQWPGAGYTFQAQEVMRCLRAGEVESPMVPWRDSLAVARTLALWQPRSAIPRQRRRNHDAAADGVIQPYAWGSRTAIPEFLGVEPTGEPQAELWFGAHPLAPSSADGEPLDKIVAQDPVGVVGRASVEAFGPRLPFLLKVIAAAQPLSCRLIRPARGPRPVTPGSRRPAFPEMHHTGLIATAGRSRSCCVRWSRSRPSADSVNRARPTRCSSSWQLPALWNLCSFGRCRPTRHGAIAGGALAVAPPGTR